MHGSSASRAVQFTAARRVAVVDEAVAAPAAGQLLVRTVLSAISPGTEMLVYRDEVPAAMSLDASIAGLTQRSGFPVRYGYSAVGYVERVGAGVSRDWLDTLVFCMHPHASRFLALEHEITAVPPGISAEAAAMFPNVETAVTLAMDGRPMVGERVAVFGQGVVGLLTTALLARFPLAELVAFDLHPLRRGLSEQMGAHEALDPAAQNEREGFDLTFELSGSPAALDDAIAVTGFHGRVVIGSWYGERRAPLDLGGAFHRSRMRLVSSQVSTIDPALSGRWTSERRRETTWRVLAELDPVRLVTHRFGLRAAADAYALLDEHPDEAVQVVLTYDA
jgi:2-desacetyl-2-hydroxyethyl bacteriochlorophyllide A dehydrogenase